MSLAESLESAAAEALKASLPEAAPVVEEEITEEVPEVATEDATEGDAEATEEAEEQEEAKPEPDAEGYVKVPVVADKLATEFTLRDAEGEIEVPDLIVEYKANGKVRKDRLDHVVKLAQFGVYNEEREQKVKAVEQQMRVVSDERQKLEQVLAEREAQLERILTDDDFLYAVKEAYQRENSPEQRAARAEREAQMLRVEREFAPIVQQGEQFNATEVEPAIEMMVQALPTVTREELEDKLYYAALAHAETAPNGTRYIPPAKFDAIRKYIVDDLAIWAQVQHARRSESRQSPEVATAKAEADKARIEAQKAKRLVGQATKPVGSTGGKSAPSKRKAPANVDEAMAQAEAEVFAAIGMR